MTHVGPAKLVGKISKNKKKERKEKVSNSCRTRK